MTLQQEKMSQPVGLQTTKTGQRLKPTTERGEGLLTPTRQISYQNRKRPKGNRTAVSDGGGKANSHAGILHTSRHSRRVKSETHGCRRTHLASCMGHGRSSQRENWGNKPGQSADEPAAAKEHLQRQRSYILWLAAPMAAKLRAEPDHSRVSQAAAKPQGLGRPPLTRRPSEPLHRPPQF